MNLIANILTGVVALLHFGSFLSRNVPMGQTAWNEIIQSHR
jgi:hypothetical protein